MESTGGAASMYEESRPAEYSQRRSHSRSRSPVRRYSRSQSRSRSRSRSPRRRYSRSRSPARYERRDYRDSRDSRHRDSRRGYDSYRSGDRYDRRDRERSDRRSAPRERRPVNRGSEEERAASKTLFIGNLPFNFEERDVAHLMERFGPLRKVTIPMERFSRRNRGFGFVEFEERRDAEDAMQKYQGYAVEGRELRLDWDVGAERKFTPRDRERTDRSDSYRSRDAPAADSYRPTRNNSPSPATRSRSLSRSPVRPEDY